MRVYQTNNQKIRHLETYKKNDLKSQVTEKSSDKIVISKKALNIKDIKKDLAKIPEIRKEKVQALKQQIQTGAYRVSAQAIASKIINNDLE